MYFFFFILNVDIQKDITHSAKRKTVFNVFDGSHKSLVHEYLGASRCVSKKEEVCIENERREHQKKKKKKNIIYERGTNVYKYFVCV